MLISLIIVYVRVRSLPQDFSLCRRVTRIGIVLTNFACFDFFPQLQLNLYRAFVSRVLSLETTNLLEDARGSPNEDLFWTTG